MSGICAYYGDIDSAISFSANAERYLSNHLQESVTLLDLDAAARRLQKRSRDTERLRIKPIVAPVFRGSTQERADALKLLVVEGEEIPFLLGWRDD
jgi:hypothetical protein